MFEQLSFMLESMKHLMTMFVFMYQLLQDKVSNYAEQFHV